MYGNKVAQNREIIGRVEITPAGNVAISIGTLSPLFDGWIKSGHITLTPEEWEDMVADVEDSRTEELAARIAAGEFTDAELGFDTDD